MGTAYSKKGYRCKWNMRDYPILHLDTHWRMEQLVVRKDMDVNENERLSNITRRNKLKNGNSL